MNYRVFAPQPWSLWAPVRCYLFVREPYTLTRWRLAYSYPVQSMAR